MSTLPQNGAPHKLAEVDWAAAPRGGHAGGGPAAIEHIVNAELTAPRPG